MNMEHGNNQSDKKYFNFSSTYSKFTVTSTVLLENILENNLFLVSVFQYLTIDSKISNFFSNILKIGIDHKNYDTQWKTKFNKNFSIYHDNNFTWG